MANRDRKDMTHPDQAPRAPTEETKEQRDARKAKESLTLDEALEETFPNSDPISPFVPAAHADEGAEERVRCAHAACTCHVTPPAKWCSDACREQQHVAEAHGHCGCGHRSCEHAHIA